VTPELQKFLVPVVPRAVGRPGQSRIERACSLILRLPHERLTGFHVHTNDAVEAIELSLVKCKRRWRGRKSRLVQCIKFPTSGVPR